MRYFTIMTGLRGCYMPDNCYVVAVKTRRELKHVIEGEADARYGYVGLSKRNVASFTAMVWREARKATLPYVLPYGDRHNMPYGIFASHTDRKDYLDYQKDADR